MIILVQMIEILVRKARKNLTKKINKIQIIELGEISIMIKIETEEGKIIMEDIMVIDNIRGAMVEDRTIEGIREI